MSSANAKSTKAATTRKRHMGWWNGHNQLRTLCPAGRACRAWKMCTDSPLLTTFDWAEVDCLACLKHHPK